MSTVTGHKRLVARLKRIRERLPEVFDDSAAKALLIRRMRARFIAEISPDGIPWPALADSTIARKKKKGITNPAKKLIETGAMYRAFGEISGRNAGLLAINTGLGFRVGIDDPELTMRARVNNYGSFRVPAREFMGLSESDVRSYREAVARRLRNIVRG
jgi:phage gpG-like protein